MYGVVFVFECDVLFGDVFLCDGDVLRYDLECGMVLFVYYVLCVIVLMW